MAETAVPGAAEEPGAGTAARDQARHARRAASFGRQAAAYAAHRPGYPDAAVRWALEPVAHRRGLRVLDLAAGTGKLTESVRRLAGERGAGPLELTAVEPDPEMLAQLRRALPGVPALAGSAEAIPLADRSVDAVLVGQAFHWFTPDLAAAEIARVLTPGGVLAGLWNFEDDRFDWLAGLAAVSGSSTSLSRGEVGPGLPATASFGPAERAEFGHAHRRTAESMVATIETRSHVLVLDHDERARLLARVRAYLRSRPETASGEFDVPIITTVLRAGRR